MAAFMHLSLKLLFVFVSLYPIFLIKALDAPRSVDKFLFAGKEWMTGRTDFNLYVLSCRTGLDYIPTCASYCCDIIFWMYSLFHLFLHRALVKLL